MTQRIKKRILYTLIGLTCLASYRAFDKIHVPKRQVSNLVVNIVNEHINVTHKSEKDGIEDIIKIAQESEYEEAWLHAVSPSESIWIENGLNELIEESEGINGSFHSLDLKISGKTIKKYDDVTFYHFHPQKNYKFDELHKWNEKVSGNTPFELIRLHYSAKSSMPSSNDIDVMVEVYKSLKDNSKRPKFKVVSVYGITEYTLTEQGLKRFVNGTECAAHWAYDVEKKAGNSSIFSKDTTHIVADKMAKRMSDDFIRVAYTPHKNTS
jgi:hypothetical protein